MTAARKRAFNSGSAWRAKAYAAINICWKQMRPELSGEDLRDERLAWIAYYLGLAGELESLTVLTDEQLGLVAGEMKRLTGVTSDKVRVTSVRTGSGSDRVPVSGNVVAFPRGDLPPRDKRNAATRPVQEGSRGEPGDHETVFLSSPEMVYTIEKIVTYLGWSAESRDAFLLKRFRTANLRMLTFTRAKAAVNAFLHIAAHRDLKRLGGGDKPVSRAEINKYVPILKERLGIDR